MGVRVTNKIEILYIILNLSNLKPYYLLKMSNSDIDSDDDFIVCKNCEKICDVSEINRVILSTSKKIMLCLTCKTWLEKVEDERLEKEKEQFKIKKQKENAKKLEAEKLSVYLQQKERWDNLTIGTKIIELEAQLCYKLHHCNPYDYNVGARLSLYENNRFKTLDSVILNSVIEQAHQSYRTKQFEEKDHMENILSILEKWLEDVYPAKYREIKGLPPPPPFDWSKYKYNIKN
jgi:hypothetical protein